MKAAYHRGPNSTFMWHFPSMRYHLTSEEQILKHPAWSFWSRTYRSYSLNANATQLLLVPSINICFYLELRLALGSSAGLFGHPQVISGSNISMRLSKKMPNILESGDLAPSRQVIICVEGRYGQTRLKK